jgi:hypothetical protein
MHKNELGSGVFNVRVTLKLKKTSIKHKVSRLNESCFLFLSTVYEYVYLIHAINIIMLNYSNLN